MIKHGPRMSDIARIITLALIWSQVGSLAHAAERQLTGSEIAKLYIGNSFEYSGKTKGVSHYTQDRFTIVDDTYGTAKGKWWIKDDTYCRRFNIGFSHCENVTDNGDGTYTSRGYDFYLK